MTETDFVVGLMLVYLIFANRRETHIEKTLFWATLIGAAYAAM